MRQDLGRRVFASPITTLFNRGAIALRSAPLIGRLVGGSLVAVRYVGRRSGRVIETPVAYSRRGDRVTIGVAAPDAKTWWRNFLGDGAPIELVDFDGRDRVGHATARRDDRGRVTVSVDLAP